jgi:hypothetical protein
MNLLSATDFVVMGLVNAMKLEVQKNVSRQFDVLSFSSM